MRSVGRVILAPFFFAWVLLGTIMVLFVISTISIGGWCEAVLVRIGYRYKPLILPMVIGIVLFVGVVLLGMGMLGHQLIGWPGAILGPVLAILAIALIDHW